MFLLSKIKIDDKNKLGTNKHFMKKLKSCKEILIDYLIINENLISF